MRFEKKMPIPNHQGDVQGIRNPLGSQRFQNLCVARQTQVNIGGNADRQGFVQKKVGHLTHWLQVSFFYR